MDPLSITAGVVALLNTAVKVGWALKEFHEGVTVVDAKIKGLLFDVENFTLLIRTIKETLEQDNVQSSLQATGHIGTHFKNLHKSINDGQATLLQLEGTIERVNKSVSVLDAARKHLRLKGATEEIVVYQLQIRSCRDTLHLSLQAITLWNQVSFQESNDLILPNLADIHQTIRRLATDLNARIANLQEVVESNARNDEIQTLTNSRNCVQSAASVISSASTALGLDKADRQSVVYGSEFGDLFPNEQNETLEKWISSNTIWEAGEAESESTLLGSNSKLSQYADTLEENDLSDSDAELEEEIVQAILEKGKRKSAEGDLPAAERLFQNCLSRMAVTAFPSSTRQKLKVEITDLLITTYRQQKNWDSLQPLIMDRIAQAARGSTTGKDHALSDMLILSEVLLEKGEYAEALLYGRKALKALRRMAPLRSDDHISTLELLIRICHADENPDEAEAYSAILSKSKKALLPQPVIKATLTEPISEETTHQKDAIVFTEVPKVHVQHSEDALPSPSKHSDVDLPVISKPDSSLETVKMNEGPALANTAAEHLAPSARKHVRGASESGRGTETSGGFHAAWKAYKDETSLKDDFLTAERFINNSAGRSQTENSDPDSFGYSTLRITSQLSPTQPHRRRSFSSINLGSIKEGDVQPAIVEAKQNLESRQDQPSAPPLLYRQRSPGPLSPLASVLPHSQTKIPPKPLLRSPRPISPTPSHPPRSPPVKNTTAQSSSVSRPNLAQLVPKVPFGDFAYAKKTYRILIVGEKGVGKSSLIRSLQKQPVGPYFLTYHGSAEAASISIDKQVYDLEIIEQLSCPGKLDKNLRAIIACFPLQFDNLGDKYNPTNVMRDLKLERAQGQIPIILAGLKEDLLIDKALCQLTHSARLSVLEDVISQGRNAAQIMRASLYIQCSAHRGSGVEDVFKAALFAGFPRQMIFTNTLAMNTEEEKHTPVLHNALDRMAEMQSERLANVGERRIHHSRSASRGHGEQALAETASSIVGTGPGGTVTESDRLKARAKAMMQQRAAALTGRKYEAPVDNNSGAKAVPVPLSRREEKKQQKRERETEEARIAKLLDEAGFL